MLLLLLIIIIIIIFKAFLLYNFPCLSFSLSFSFFLSFSAHPPLSTIALSKSSRRRQLWIDQHWCVHASESIEERRLWLLPHCFACLLRLSWVVSKIYRVGAVSDCTTAILWDVASRICLKQHATSLCSFLQAFSQSVLLESKWCNHTVVLTRLYLGISPV